MRGAVCQKVHEPLKNHNGGYKPGEYADIYYELVEIYVVYGHYAVYRIAYHYGRKKRRRRGYYGAQKREREQKRVRSQVFEQPPCDRSIV